MAVIIINKDVDFSAGHVGVLKSIALPAGIDGSLQYWLLPRRNSEFSQINFADAKGAGISSLGAWNYKGNSAFARDSADYSYWLNDFKSRVEGGFTIFAVSAFNRDIASNGVDGQQSVFMATRKSSQALNNRSINLCYEGRRGRMQMRAHSGRAAAMVEAAIHPDTIAAMGEDAPIMTAAVLDLAGGQMRVHVPAHMGIRALPEGMADIWDEIDWAVALGRGFGDRDAGIRHHFLFALFARPMSPDEVGDTAGLIAAYLQARGVAGVIAL